MKTRVKVIPDENEQITLDIANVQTAREYKEPFPREAFNIVNIENVDNNRFKKIRICKFFFGLIILGCLLGIMTIIYLRKTQNNNMDIMYSASSSPIPIPLSPTLSYWSSPSLSPTLSSIIPIPLSPALSISSSPTLSSLSSLATSSILTPSETTTPSSSPLSSISSILTPSETSSISLSESVSISPSESESVSISPSREYEYIVADRHECSGYTAHWCHHNCNHHPPYCPYCCIKI